MQQIKIIFTGFLLCMAIPLAAQETFIIDKDTLELRKEVKGTLSLYWTEEAHRYRYFVQKGDRMVELRNTDGNQEYKEQLAKLTADADIKTRDVQFVLYSLKHFTNTYNSLIEDEYSFNEATENIQQRIGLFTGLTNNIYTENPKNILAPVVGLEYEFYDPNLAPRHSAFLQLRQSFKQDDYRYSSTALSLNYRFKALYFSNFDLHIDTRLATLYYSEDSISITNDSGEVIAVKEESGFSFTAPLSFGIGTDIQVTTNSYITVGYNDIFAVVWESNGNFPIDFTIGYKYNL
ncbi:hypothetical protein [Salinimicrobium xinjiangense]|uniref:hypothetical protein n=1 Tax=Salinimicrobium xinjiangense TaxID=438596 RepID=UPI000428AE70|nr:hypothetical protein [Salinimicrobium xinjiangense]